jgi:hypothetical protein
MPRLLDLALATGLVLASCLASVALAEDSGVMPGEDEGGKLTISGNLRHINYACEERGAQVVEIVGNGHDVTRGGACKTITVKGNANHVRLDGVGAIIVRGNKITVTWRRAVEGSEPAITTAGRGVSITKVAE